MHSKRTEFLLYRFSPIQNETMIWKAYEYCIEQAAELSIRLLGVGMPISIVKIFAHYPKEYQFLYRYIEALGPKSSFSNAESLYVSVDKIMNNHRIRYLGVRIVDPYRLQVGCADYETGNFNSLATKHKDTTPFIRFTHDTVDMLELWQPDIDVLGYIIPSD